MRTRTAARSVVPLTRTVLEAGSASTTAPGIPASTAWAIVAAQWPQVMSSTRRGRALGFVSTTLVDLDWWVLHPHMAKTPVGVDDAGTLHLAIIGKSSASSKIVR